MNITVYLPDTLGAQAKDARLPLSRLLRAAVENELMKLARIDQIALTWPRSPFPKPKMVEIGKERAEAEGAR